MTTTCRCEMDDMSIVYFKYRTLETKYMPIYINTTVFCLKMYIEIEYILLAMNLFATLRNIYAKTTISITTVLIPVQRMH